MKPFHVFAGSEFYPSGGWEDWHSSYDTLAEAVAVGDALIGKNKWFGQFEWAHVVDVVLGDGSISIVKKFEHPPS